MAASGHYNKAQSWLIHHASALQSAISDCLSHPLSSLLTFLVIGIAMALPLGFYLCAKNVVALTAQIDTTPSISLYLRVGASSQANDAALKAVRAEHDVLNAHLISATAGLRKLEAKLQLTNALGGLKTNPLPAVIVATPIETARTPMQLSILKGRLANAPFVTTAQLDLAWVKRLTNILIIAKRFNLGLMLLLGIGVILITGNTIRLALQSQHKTIRILQMIGATPPFIRRPMLYRGLLYGLGGGVLATAVISAAAFALQAPIDTLITSYGSAFVLFLPGIALTLAALAASAALGLIGAWIAVKPVIK